jgi:hypothetical protein
VASAQRGLQCSNRREGKDGKEGKSDVEERRMTTIFRGNGKH